MNYNISKKDSSLNGEITIPSSKSISNRALIIHALSYSGVALKNLSSCDDTKSMQDVFFSNTREFNVGHAGTSMRFLTAYLSKVMGEWTITGSDRMKQRPIGILVDALNSLGAQITYLEKEGFPPLKILGSNLTGKSVELSGNTSSQYISALLLIAPTLAEGLEMKLTGKIVSSSYIKMTLGIMNDFGIESSFVGNTIKIKKQNYLVKEYTIEADWSGVSYWYSALALAKEGKIKLNGLKKISLQGDSALVSIFEKLGVKTVFSKKGMHIEKSEVMCKKLNHNFTEIPDLAQTFAVCSALKNIPFHFTGLETLKIKETDRIAALITELGKLGFVLTEPAPGELAWNGEKTQIDSNISIDTYHDHRMAMSFAPAALILDNIIINDAQVVSKSYPEFWEEMKNLSFDVK